MTPHTEDAVLISTHDAYLANDKNQSATAKALGCSRETVQRRLRMAAERGLLGPVETMPGYHIASLSRKIGDSYVKQVRAPGEVFEIPPTHVTGKITVNRDAEGRVIQDWLRVEPDKVAQAAFMRAAIDALKDEIPRAAIVAAPLSTLSELLCQYTITDAHLGALAWNEETRGGDYDLSIGERLLLDWFSAAIAAAPPARRAVFAQMGDFLHYDSFKSITPEHGHLLDGDTRYPKMVRAAIRVVRAVIRMLLEKHDVVEVIMSDANHDPSSEVWLREMFAAFLEDEPRVTIDTTPGSYNVVEHGLVSLYFHHGHRRNPANVDSVFVGKFREVYGRTKFSYGHVGHKHADQLKSTNLMKVEQHETLAAPDAYAANGGWLSGRSAKVIVYHARFGEVARSTLTPEMVAGAYAAANDNQPKAAAA